MLESILVVNENVNISTYVKFINFLKRYSHGFHSKKSEVLTSTEITEFFNKARDDNYLAIKVSSFELLIYLV